MKKSLFLILFFGLCISQLFADLPFRNQRRDMFRMLPVNNQSIVFLGNSITQGNEWSETFANDPRVINRGISGNTSAEVLNNMDYIVGGKPAKIFLLIGINDSANPDIVVPNIRKTIELVQRESPSTQLYIQSILPNNNNANVKVTNALLAQLCVEKGVNYVDIYSKLVVSEASSTLSSADANDGLHLLGSGYRKWTAGFEAYTGIAPVFSSGANVSISSANANYVNQRLSGFALLPATGQDILMLGDFHVNTGEWRELLRNPNVKSRGIGVALSGTSISLPELKDMIPYIVKNNPAKVFISCGRKDLETNGKTVAEAITSFTQILSSIRAAAPQTEIYIQSLIPNVTAATNTDKFVPFNDELKKLANDINKIYFVDPYAALVKDGVLDSQYAYSNGGLNGRGYLKWAEVLAPFVDAAIKPLSVASYDLCVSLANARQQLYTLKDGTGAGTYPAVAVTNFRQAIDQAAAVAYNPEATTTELQQQLTTLNDATNAIKNSQMTLPLASTSSAEYWYKLSAPLRNPAVFMKGNTAGTGVTFEAENNYRSQQWKFTLRGDNTYNIINRKDNSFLDPNAAYNTQIKTSATEPAAGWSFRKADSFSKFIITSGTVELNLTGQNTLFNWSTGNSGNDITDTGCQYLITEVTRQPDEEPVVTLPAPLLKLTNINCSGTAPVLISASQAAPVMAKDTLTVAIDFTPSSTTGDAILVASTDPTSANKFFGIGTITNFTKYGVRYVGDNSLEGWYTQAYSPANARHRMVITMSPGTSNYNYYMDEAYGRNVSGMGAYGYYYFGKIPNPSLYLGGVVSSTNGNRYPFTGTIHSIQFFPGVLSAEQIKLINSVSTGIEDNKVENVSERPFVIGRNSIQMKNGLVAKLYDLNGKTLPTDNLKSGYYILRTNEKSYKILIP